MRRDYLFLDNLSWDSAPHASLPVKHAYYKAAVINAGQFLNDTRRYMVQLHRNEGPLETWTKGVSVMLMISFGHFIESFAQALPPLDEPDALRNRH